MMLKKRLIPKLQIQFQNVGKLNIPVLVTTRNYGSSRRVGDPVSQAKIYEAQLADELIVLNIESRPLLPNSPIVDLIERLATETFMPLTVGGGVTSLDDFSLLLDAGADKISINTSALKQPEIIGQAARRFGSQCVVVSIDFRKDESGNLRVVSERGAKMMAASPFEWAIQAVEHGAGEILLTDVDADGESVGLNCQLSSKIAATVEVPVILSGGCGTAQHFCDGFIHGKAEGVAAGTYFCFRDQNPMQTRSHISNAGIPIRMLT